MREREPFGSWPARPFAEQSQIALELALTSYAAIVTLVLIRLLLLAVGVDDRLWVGEFVFQFTDPAVRVLQFLPGSDRTLFGKVTLPELCRYRRFRLGLALANEASDTSATNAASVASGNVTFPNNVRSDPGGN